MEAKKQKRAQTEKGQPIDVRQMLDFVKEYKLDYLKISSDGIEIKKSIHADPMPPQRTLTKEEQQKIDDETMFYSATPSGNM
jgi:hypothetical protein